LLTEITSVFDVVKNDIQFSYTSINPMDKRMEIAAYFLAAIKVLDKEGESFEKIRKLIIEIAKESVQPKNKFQSFLKKLYSIINTSNKPNNNDYIFIKWR
jgi:hypothetical protein